MPAPSASGPSTQLTALLGYLDSDPGNVTLLNDVANTALAEGQPEVARTVLERFAKKTPLSDQSAGLLALAIMQLGQHQDAAARLEELLRRNPGEAPLRFNLAWCRAMLGDQAGALDLLDAAAVEALPQAAALNIQLKHARGNFDEAYADAKGAVRRHPRHPGVLAATSVLAMDMEDPALAKQCAVRAGEHSDALATLGVLALGDSNPRQASDLFERALARNQGNARAWIGKGLTELTGGGFTQAARDLGRGAEMFGDHVGSWIAVGWAELLGSNLAAARAHFQRALDIDHNFSESHGSLAVVAIMEGKVDEAQGAVTRALKLDANSFSGAFAQTLLLTARGQPDAARQIFEAALHRPIDASGRTIAHALARFAL